MKYITQSDDKFINKLKTETDVRYVDGWGKYFILDDNNEYKLIDYLEVNCQTITQSQMFTMLQFLYPLKPKSIYELEDGDNYYYIDFYGKVESGDGWENVCEDLLEIGNIFTSLDSAYDKLDKIKATEKVKKRIYELNDGWTPNWYEEYERKYFIEYQYYSDGFMINYYAETKSLDNCFYLKSYELAEQLLNELEKELKIMLEVE